MVTSKKDGSSQKRAMVSSRAGRSSKVVSRPVIDIEKSVSGTFSGGCDFLILRETPDVSQKAYRVTSERIADNRSNQGDAEKGESRIARLFNNGRSQSVRIPADFRFDTDSVVITRWGAALLIEPAPNQGLLALLSSWEPLDEEMPQIDDAPPEPEEMF